MTMPVAEPALSRSLPMTWEEYLAWDHEGIAEWVNGEVHVDMSVGDAHTVLTAFLIKLLGLWCDVTGAGLIKHEPYLMRAMPGAAGREPDVLFVQRDNAYRIREQFLDGPADLVVEVISPDSVVRDRDEKFLEYQAAGVREYWIIDPRDGHQRADFYVLAPDPVRPGAMAFRPVPIRDDGTYHSAVLEGFWMRVGWLWDEHASPLKCLGEVAGRDRVLALLD